MGRILLVEDEKTNQLIVKAVLAQHHVEIASSLTAARKCLEEDFDVILLDVHLPDGDGFEFFVECQQQIARSGAAVIFLTGKSGVADKVTGFSLGADDYITKPFDMVEFRARIESKIRRKEGARDQSLAFSKHGFHFDIHLQQVRYENGTSSILLDTTTFEFKLLLYLVKHKDHVLSRERLLKEVWGGNLNIVDRTIDTHMSHLRKKLAGTSLRIQSVYGAGYKLTGAAAA